MAKEETKKSEKQCCCSKESKVMEGFKFGLGLYIAFMAGSVLVGGMTALIWLVMQSL